MEDMRKSRNARVSGASLSLFSWKFLTVSMIAVSFGLNIYLSFEKNVFNLLFANIELNQTVERLEEENAELLKENNQLKAQVRDLEKELQLFMVKVTGFVNTTGWDRFPDWELPRWPVSITFDNGIEHKVRIASGGMYRIDLQNNQTYVVKVQWANLLTTDEIKAGVFQLEASQETETEDWDLSKP